MYYKYYVYWKDSKQVINISTFQGFRGCIIHTLKTIKTMKTIKNKNKQKSLKIAPYTRDLTVWQLQVKEIELLMIRPSLINACIELYITRRSAFAVTSDVNKDWTPKDKD